MANQFPEGSVPELPKPESKKAIVEFFELATHSVEAERLTVRFIELRPADAGVIRSGMRMELLPTGALEKAACHPAIARGYIAFLAQHRAGSLEDIQGEVIEAFRQLMALLVAERQQLYQQYTRFEHVDDTMILSGVTLGLLTRDEHPKLSVFEGVLAGGPEYDQFLSELQQVISLS